MFNKKSSSKEFKKINIYPVNLDSRCFDYNVFQSSGGLFGKKKKSAILIICVLGGISYNEIEAMEKLASSGNYGDV